MGWLRWRRHRHDWRVLRLVPHDNRRVVFNLSLLFILISLGDVLSERLYLVQVLVRLFLVLRAAEFYHLPTSRLLFLLGAVKICGARAASHLCSPELIPLPTEPPTFFFVGNHLDSRSLKSLRLPFLFQLFLFDPRRRREIFALPHKLLVRRDVDADVFQGKLDRLPLLRIARCFRPSLQCLEDFFGDLDTHQTRQFFHEPRAA
mmetsp:Transcript_12622/g.45403  ORF Transcript_12622/g.45403 Transcript_12622/m.45403 type:complete len:204 (+) Transcript_12622:335-946(+)